MFVLIWRVKKSADHVLIIPNPKSKNASVVEYARSTGFEAVLGYLYLLGDLERISYLLSFIEEEQLKGQDAVKAYKP